MADRSDEEARALRLVREALAQGYLVSLYYEDDADEVAVKDSDNYEAIKEEIVACDIMGMTIRKLGPDGKPLLGDGAWFMLIYGNGIDSPIADHTDNEVGHRFAKLIMPE